MSVRSDIRGMSAWLDLVNTARETRSGKILATLAVVVGASMVLGSTAALAASRQAGAGSLGRAGFQSGTLRVEFTDPSGRPCRAPLVSVTKAVPGMAPTRSEVTLTNTGTLAGASTLSTTDLASGSPSLDDVLVVTVRSEEGRQLYRGKLSALALTDEPLQPGRSRTYALSISWPATLSDDDYQGLALTFGLQATATPAE